MGRRYFSILGLAVLLFVALVPAAAQSKKQGGAPEIGFTVSMPKPYTHMLDVEVKIKRGPGAQLPKEEVLVMPVLTPGSYLIREFERKVERFRDAR